MYVYVYMCIYIYKYVCVCVYLLYLLYNYLSYCVYYNYLSIREVEHDTDNTMYVHGVEEKVFQTFTASVERNLSEVKLK